MNDTISRQAAIQALDNAAENWNIAEPYHEGIRAGFRNSARLIMSLPSAQPEPEEFEWCTDCKEYDQDKQCCHRWTKVIRETVEELKQAQPDRKTGQWIKRKKGAIGYNCSCCGKSDISNHFDYCPNCGADMRGGEDG